MPKKEIYVILFAETLERGIILNETKKYGFLDYIVPCILVVLGVLALIFAMNKIESAFFKACFAAITLLVVGFLLTDRRIL